MTTPEAKNSTAKQDGGNKDEGGSKKVRLLARFWLRPIPDTKPLEFERFWQGDELEVTDKEFENLNQFKKNFEEIEG